MGHKFSNDNAKKSLCSSYVDTYTNNCQSIQVKDLGKSRSQTTPSSSPNAHSSDIHVVNNKHRNISGIKDRKKNQGNSTLINRSGSVDSMSPMSSELSCDATNKYCDKVQKATTEEVHDDKKEEGEIDEIEEMDEDLLYLRLMALRSIDLRSEGSKAEKYETNIELIKDRKTQNEVQCIDVEDMVDEMEDLLNEADQAAKLSPNHDANEDDGIEVIERELPIIPVIDIPDSDEEQIDLELERWTKNKSISIASLDTTASFQQTTAYNSADIVKEEINGKSQNMNNSNDLDYSQLVQRLRQTLEKQRKHQNILINDQKRDNDDGYSPTQSPFGEVQQNKSLLKTSFDTNEDHLKYSPTQSPLSEVVDTPIGSGGITPGDLSPTTIPLQLPLSLDKKSYRFESMNDDQLPPLPPGSPPCLKVETKSQLDNSKMKLSHLPELPHYTPTPLVSNWKSQGKNDSRSFTPPPPGEEDVIEYSYCQLSDKNQSNTIDMELGSDNEAEIQFFEDQKEQVKNNGKIYQHSSYTQSYINGYDVLNQDRIFHKDFTHPPKMSDVLYYANPQDRYNAFLHAVSNKDSPSSSSASGSNKSSSRKTRKRKSITSNRGNKAEKRSYGSNCDKEKQNNLGVSLNEILAERLEQEKHLENGNLSDDDDAEQLRALLLSDLHKKKENARKSKTKTPALTDSKDVPETIVKEVNIERPAEKTKNISENVEINVEIKESSSEPLENSRSHPSSGSTNVVRNKNINKSLPITSTNVENSCVNSNSDKSKENKHLTNNRKIVETKLIKNRENGLSSISYIGALSELSKLSESTQRLIEEVGTEAIIRNFPNLVKPFIIPLSSVNAHANVHKKIDKLHEGDLGVPDFASQLNDFMREIRTKSNVKPSRKRKVKTTPPPKPIRKNIPRKNQIASGMKQKIHIGAGISSNDLNSSISPAAKNHLMTASVSSLPQKKQEEYKRLKALIARKEKSRKQLITRTIVNQDVKNIDANQDENDDSSTADPGIGKNIGNDSTQSPKLRNLEDPIAVQEGENQLRINLLTNMEKTTVDLTAGSPGVSEVNIPLRHNETSNNATITIAPSTSMKISITNTGNRNVSVNESSLNLSKKQNPNPRKELLDLKEKELGMIRKTITNDLYKLSAQLSQLRNETNRKKTAEEYLQNLKQRISEVESLVARKNERIVQIKEVVMHSHNELSNKREELVVVENDCKQIGNEIFGPFYKPPQESSRKIKEKIALIKKHANEIQPNNKIFKNLSNDTDSDNMNTNSNANSGEGSTEFNNKLLSSIHDTTSSSAQNGNTEYNDIKKKDIGGISSTGSALAHLRQSEHKNKFDPHKEFCRYELQGKCNDDSCGYQHQFPKV